MTVHRQKVIYDLMDDDFNSCFFSPLFWHLPVYTIPEYLSIVEKKNKKTCNCDVFQACGDIALLITLKHKCQGNVRKCII